MVPDGIMIECFLAPGIGIFDRDGPDIGAPEPRFHPGKAVEPGVQAPFIDDIVLPLSADIEGLGIVSETTRMIGTGPLGKLDGLARIEFLLDEPLFGLLVEDVLYHNSILLILSLPKGKLNKILEKR
jgi:hypothetical protein